MHNFDPSGIGLRNGQIFGLPYSLEESELVVIPVPWEVTVSYRTGTASAPQRMLEASLQIDLYDPINPRGWQAGIFMLPVNEELAERSTLFRMQAKKLITELENGANPADFPEEYRIINEACSELNQWVENQALTILDQGKIPVVLGGDHSTPLGNIRALASRYPNFGILQIDAHCDLRQDYEGFTYSHASIFYNALQIPQVHRLIQVGIRDYCQEELELMEAAQPRVQMFDWRMLRQEQFSGENWKTQVDRIVMQLPQYVYLSIDIDGLQPAYCPNTGTPVPGGLDFEQALFLIERVIRSGRHIIGFDVCEVGDDEWDATVGARMLYRTFLLVVSQL